MTKLMTCKSCGNQISKKAAACPHCGHAYVRTFYQDYRRRQWGCVWIMIAVLLAIFVYALTQS
jgi:predicted RNA-binding Zn-ribbon protein involved in translation (DUF1610 family)